MMVRCEHCGGDGEIETCIDCHNVVENCTCHVTRSAFEDCPECNGAGEVDDEEEEGD